MLFGISEAEIFLLGALGAIVAILLYVSWSMGAQKRQQDSQQLGAVVNHQGRRRRDGAHRGRHPRSLLGYHHQSRTRPSPLRHL